jgi:hypothetical protein
MPKVRVLLGPRNLKRPDIMLGFVLRQNINLGEKPVPLSAGVGPLGNQTLTVLNCECLFFGASLAPGLNLKEEE